MTHATNARLVETKDTMYTKETMTAVEQQQNTFGSFSHSTLHGPSTHTSIPSLNTQLDRQGAEISLSNATKSENTIIIPTSQHRGSDYRCELDGPSVRAHSQHSEVSGAQTSPVKISRRAQYWDLWMKNWFLLGLIVVIVLARYYPNAGRTGGPIRPEYSVKYGVTSCIFLLSGLSLKTADILRSAMNYRAHLITQLTSFVVIPFFVKCLTLLVGLSPLNESLLAGMCVTSATSTTVSSNVVMTANSDGSEPLALFNAALGNLLGVFLSPLLVLVLLHSTAQSPSGQHGLDYATILRDLGSTILLPIVFGQICLYIFPRPIAWAKRMVHFPTLNSTCLLILVWTVFCDAFYNNTFSVVTAGEIIAIGALQALTFWSATLFLVFLSRARPRKIRILKAMEREQQKEKEEGPCQLEAGLANSQPPAHHPCTDGLSIPRSRFQVLVEPLSKADTVAVLFCGGTKSVAMGIPMIKILYSSGSWPHLC
ncbi:hypothetical protein BGZ70_000910 [Mortierella alpina]|uniref:Uncharacterized protein n=1 Tax=Mortierella alpina TaxID=64518 RepID=A0A9P6JBU2_MORAP|nr:hypothetical protein BGZ70_000910 [Mortierella alpina]